MGQVVARFDVRVVRLEVEDPQTPLIGGTFVTVIGKPPDLFPGGKIVFLVPPGATLPDLGGRLTLTLERP